MEVRAYLTHFKAVILIALLGIAVYANSIGGKFIWDDDVLIAANPHVRSWSSAGKIFSESVERGVGKESAFYRPLQMLTYIADYSFWKLKPAGYHLTNIFLHIFVSLAVYWLIYILFGDIFLSLLSALFFVIHPIHTEVVSYISGRTDSLAALFMLLGLVAYIRDIRLNRWYIYMVVLSSYALALLSRENSLIFPLLLLVYHYSCGEKISFKRFMPILFVVFVYVIVRRAVLGPLPLPSSNITTTFLERLPGFFVAVTEYIRLLLLPLNQHMEYGYALFSFCDPRAVTGVLIVLALIICAVKTRKTDKIIFFSILWFFASLMPVSGAYQLNAYMAGHWLYLPSMGLFLALARGLTILCGNKKFQTAAISMVLVLLFFYSYLTMRQNNYWKDPVSFYVTTLKYAPDSYRMHYNLGIAYSGAGKYGEAIASYKKAIEFNPAYEEAYYNLGNAYAAIGEDEEAIGAYRRCVGIRPDYSAAYNNMGRVYSNTGRTEEAVTCYEKAAEVDPDYFNAYYNLGDEQRRAKNNKGAIAAYEKALMIYPRDAATHNNLAVVYYYEKRYDMAIKHCDAAIESGFGVNPDFLNALKPHR